MNALNMLKDVVGALTGLAVSLIVFGVAAGVVFGDVPFVGGVLDNALALVDQLGSAGCRRRRSRIRWVLGLSVFDLVLCGLFVKILSLFPCYCA